MQEAARRGVTIAVAVVDRGGDPIQQDLMDGAPSAAPAIAQATAAAAALFDCESAEFGRHRFGPPEVVAALVVPRVLGLPGGLPVRHDGRLVAGLGVGGVEPEICRDIARAALAQS